jgi:glycosyltransferase involved in cell wall biosynthesis
MGEVDVVAAHGSTTLPACAIAGAIRHTPFVYRQISDSHFWASTRARRWRTGVAMRRAAHVVALWSGAAQALTELFRVGADKITVVPNGVPGASYRPLEQDERVEARRNFGVEPGVFTASFVGALVPEKGVDLAIAAIAAIDRAQLLVAGNGPERERLIEIAEGSAPGRVRFVGSLEDPRPAYAAADVLVLPSRGGDSMPAVLIEAGMLGLPVVSTHVGGIPDIVEEGVTGHLGPPGDLGSLIASLQDLAADTHAAARLGMAARAACMERFEIHAVAAAWSAVLVDAQREAQTR